MGLVKAHFNVLPLGEAVERLKVGALPSRAACITFDDGYADNAEVALPILKRLGLPATFFVATGYLNGGRMFNDTVIETIRSLDGPTLTVDDPALGTLDIGSPAAKRAAVKRILDVWRYLSEDERQSRAEVLGSRATVPLPTDLMMRDEQVVELCAAGMEIGAHTATHPILPRISTQRARSEIASSREYLEGLLREPVRLFAYPNGRPGIDYTGEHVQMVRELGFDAAVSTARGVANAATDLYQLPRFTPWDRDPIRFSARLAWGR
jgi:peptidoglycan/xylan/chitin deacetylase (PgdA/CDA1 family)